MKDQEINEAEEARHARRPPVQRPVPRTGRGRTPPRRPWVGAGIMALVLASGCGDDGGPIPIAEIHVDPTTVTRVVGQTLQLSVTAMDADGTPIGGRPVTWSSSNSTLATVDLNGMVTLLNPGTVTITASCEGKTDIATITIIPVPVAAVVVTPMTVTLLAGETTRLDAAIFDSVGGRLTDRVVTWSSSDPDVASVDNTGLVAGITVGGATITATCGGRSGSAHITVKDPCYPDGYPKISTGQTVNGELSAEDCGFGMFFDVYELTLAATTTVQITLTSTAFDAYLVLLGEFTWTEDDDSGGGTDARITETLSPGTYTVVVTSVLLETGPYVLSVQSVAPAAGARDAVRVSALPVERLAGIRR